MKRFLRLTLLLLTWYCSMSFGRDLTLELINKSICHSASSFELIFRKNKKIPNAIDGENGYASYSNDFVQPRLAQLAVNIWLTENYWRSYKLECDLSRVSQAAERYYLKASKNESRIIPWKTHLDGTLAKEHIMNVYDLGDWLTISTAYYFRSRDKEKTSRYIRRQTLKLMSELRNGNSRGLKLTDNNKYLSAVGSPELGHLTLAYDSLILASVILQDENIKHFVYGKLQSHLKALKNRTLFENGVNLSSNNMMTYGELFETLFLFKDIYPDIMEDSLIEDYFLSFISNHLTNGKFNYYLTKRGCQHAMSLEGSGYRPLHWNPDFPGLASAINHTLEVLNFPPSVEVCSNRGPRNDTDLGVLYPYLKLMYYIKSKDIQLPASNGIEETLTYINNNLKSKLGYFNNPKEKSSGITIKDLSANVWLLNEALVPLMNIYHSNGSISFEDFQGCNFIFIKPYRDMALNH